MCIKPILNITIIANNGVCLNQMQSMSGRVISHVSILCRQNLP